MTTYELCEQCNGSGDYGDWYCGECGGTGMVPDDIDADGPDEWEDEDERGVS